MTDLRLESYTMPAAELPRENPLPPLAGLHTASAVLQEAAGGPRQYPDQGREREILPYSIQDQYDRLLRPRSFKVAVLENRFLRATFLLELGGRLWSLYHKPSQTELLHVNPVFQPANLAVRDAWFSGGVEWNISIVGHSPFTCSPLFAARVQDDDGTPVLRLYEWDRLRQVPFQIDCFLPPDSPFLLVRPRIINPNHHTVPMYWWSNIAVNERPDTRVLGPAASALRHDYDGKLVAHEVPIYDGTDVTYPARRANAADLYFRISSDARPWITALDGQGRGLIHTSTDRLMGRKIFNWGFGPGGRRWQEFLSRPGQAYLEIQAGLAQTQGEHLPMPAHAQWSWLEAYGLMETDPRATHGPDWARACQTVEQTLERMLPRSWMQGELDRTAAIAERAPEHMLHHGSGWGALERHRRLVCGQLPFASAALPFADETLGEPQAPWLALLKTGALPDRPPTQAPGAWLVQSDWRRLLEEAVAAGRGDHWLAWLHLGVMRFSNQDRIGAKAVWEQSLRQAPSAWAYRNLAFLAREAGDNAQAAELWLAAMRLAPALLPLAIECAQVLLQANRPQAVQDLVARLDPVLQSHGRVQLLKAVAALACDDLETVQAFFNSSVEIANIREKETILSDLWFQWQEKLLAAQAGVAVNEAIRQKVRREYPPPQRFDFRSNGQLPACNQTGGIAGD